MKKSKKTLGGIEFTVSDLIPNVKIKGMTYTLTPTSFLVDILEHVCPDINKDMSDKFPEEDCESQHKIVLREILNYIQKYEDLVSMVKTEEKHKPRCFGKFINDCGMCFYNDNSLCEIKRLIDKGHSQEEAEKIVDDRH